jgi:hypothetical protein
VGAGAVIFNFWADMLIPSPMTADSIVRGSLLRDSDMYLRMKG